MVVLQLVLRPYPAFDMAAVCKRSGVVVLQLVLLSDPEFVIAGDA